jgi:hypothetical protein
VPEQFYFAMEVILNGLMAGVLYALVALGLRADLSRPAAFSTMPKG